MKQQFFVWMMMLSSLNIFSQTQSFDVFIYQTPQFFTKSEQPSRVQYDLINNDTSFCSIILLKRMNTKGANSKEILRQWKNNVIKYFPQADKKPSKIYTQQMLDGWTSNIAVGNFYQNKKKCVLMLNAFKKNNTVACVVFAFSDKFFKGPVELFSENLHLVDL